MTYDTDEDDSSIKLEIHCLENDDAGHWKRFFEEGLGALLDDKHFLLLYVPKDGAKMQIIRPTTDPYHRQRMIKRVNEAKSIPSFYYALSHLWGISKDNPQLWEEIGDYVDDMDGQPAAPVSMRPEKRATLLALLRAHPDSYWWIDVLCARTDTPLDIMGDIYSCCYECIAMIDCEPSLLSTLHTEEKSIKDVLYDMEYKPSPEDIDRAKRLYAKYPQLINQTCQLQQSEWWKRVWTWQEMALPYGAVRLIAETDDHHFQTNTTTMDDLMNCFKNMVHIIYSLDPLDGAYQDHIIRDNLENTMYLMMEICQSRTFNKHRAVNKHRIGKKSLVNFLFLISSLAQSRRRCMDPVDYVYGVLGMFQFNIPRMSDPNAVWRRFLSELDSYSEDMINEEFELDGEKAKFSGFSDRAYLADLRKAKNMSDVYGNLLRRDDE